MNRKRKIVTMILVSITLVLTMCTTASATYYGWWDNHMEANGGGLESKSPYHTMATIYTGTLGHWTVYQPRGQTKTLKIRIYYYYNGSYHYSAYKNYSINTDTWVETYPNFVLPATGLSVRFHYLLNADDSTYAESFDCGWFYDQ